MEHAGEDAIVMAAGTGGGSGVRSDGLFSFCVLEVARHPDLGRHQARGPVGCQNP